MDAVQEGEALDPGGGGPAALSDEEKVDRRRRRRGRAIQVRGGAGRHAEAAVGQEAKEGRGQDQEEEARSGFASESSKESNLQIVDFIHWGPNHL